MEEIAIIDVPAQRVAGIKKTGKYTLIPELIMQLAGYIIGNRIAFA
jgi:effector-binding domain-containing protein